MVTRDTPGRKGRGEQTEVQSNGVPRPPDPGDRSFPKILRLRKRREFDRVFARKCSASGSCLIIYACENQYGFPRLGLSVSRKCGKSVVRNRWKRLMREVFRLNRARIQAGIDLVMIPRRDAEPDFATMAREFPGLIRRLSDRLRRTAASATRESGGECAQP